MKKSLFIFCLSWLLSSVAVWAQVTPMSRPANQPSESQKKEQQKQDTATVAPENPLQNLMERTHDPSVKRFVRGQIFSLTGKAASSADSLRCAGFIFEAKKMLDSTDVEMLRTLFTDTTRKQTRGYVVSAPFTPQLGLVLEDDFGKKERFFFMFDSEEEGIWLTKGGVDRAFVSPETLCQLAQLHKDYFGGDCLYEMRSKVELNTSTPCQKSPNNFSTKGFLRLDSEGDATPKTLNLKD